jgi:predicted RNase H-like HicB family nuclease
MNFGIDSEREDDGRWIAEIPEIPGVPAYGVTPLQAGARAALGVLAERMENEVSLSGINTMEKAGRIARNIGKALRRLREYPNTRD